MFAIEVQHSSDKELDGSWHEIETHVVDLEDKNALRLATAALILVNRLHTVTSGYIGRPVRIIERA